MNQRVLIIGGGLAGLAAATALAPRGFEVTILEARPRLGGRASSFTDATTGQLIDACQHVSMGCCTNFAHFCRTVGIDHLLEPQPTLHFMTPDGEVTRWEASGWPAPFHYASSFARAHFLKLGEKLRVAYGLFALLKEDRSDDPPFAEWLLDHGQNTHTIRRFWEVVLVSALNEAPDRVGLRYARQVFVEGFLKDRRGGIVEVPRVPLGRLYGTELRSWLTSHGVNVRLETGAQGLVIADGQVRFVRLRSGESLTAEAYVLATPHERVLDLLPSEVIDSHPEFGRLKELETSPITSVHLWYDRPVLDLPHVVLVSCLGQWLFNRGLTEQGEHYLQVVISAALQLRGMGHELIEQLLATELAKLFPTCRAAKLLRARVVMEKSATFSARPGVDELRPGQRSSIPNLFLAGDWTRTGWPATMEGAVRSGYLAAEAVLRSDEQLLATDLDGVRRYPV